MLLKGHTHSVENHSVVISEIYSHCKNISSNHLFSNFFSKHVTLTKFLPKMRESKFPKLPHCALRTVKNLWKFTLTFLRKKIGESNAFANKLLKN